MKVGRDALWSWLLCANHMAVPTLLPSCRPLSGLSPAHAASPHANLLCFHEPCWIQWRLHPSLNTHTLSIPPVSPLWTLIKDGICNQEVPSEQRLWSRHVRFFIFDPHRTNAQYIFLATYNRMFKFRYKRILFNYQFWSLKSSRHMNVFSMEGFALFRFSVI